METHFQCLLKLGQIPKLWLSLCSIFTMRSTSGFFVWKNSALKKVMGSLTIAWGKCSTAAFKWNFRSAGIFIPEVKGVAHQGVHLCLHIAHVCTKCFGAGSIASHSSCTKQADMGQATEKNIINNQGRACHLQLIPQDKGKCVSSPLGNWDVKIAPFFLVW